MIITKTLENEILQLAVEAFKNNAPLQEIEIIEEEYPNRITADRILQILIQGKEIRFHAEVKANVTRANKLLVMMRRKEVPYPLLLVTRYINAEMAEQLKQDGIEFIDAAGNAYINQPPLYIFIKGNKPTEVVKPAPIKRAFNATGLRVIYAFLCNPGLENKPYRTIAATADVALGTVVWLMRELKELGYLMDMGKQGNKIIRKENLFQRWITAYPENLRPRLTMGLFRGDNDWWQQKALDPAQAQWGGEAAAAKLTKYLKPQIITLYADPHQLNPLLLDNRLKKDPAGDVEILERFWKPMETRQDKDLVHPILIYADLIATGNQRNIETAKIIYEQHIVQLIREA